MDLAVVTVTIDAGSTKHSLALELKEDELDLLSVLEIKEMLIRRLTPEISPSALEITIGGATLYDDWLGEDFGMQDGTDFLVRSTKSVSLKASKPPPASAPPMEAPTPVQAEVVAPPPPPPPPPTVSATPSAADGYIHVNGDTDALQSSRPLHPHDIMAMEGSAPPVSRSDSPLSKSYSKYRSPSSSRAQAPPPSIETAGTTGGLRPVGDILPPQSPAGKTAMEAHVHEMQVLTMSGQAGKGVDPPGEKIKRRLKLHEAFDSLSRNGSVGESALIEALLAAGDTDPQLPAYFRYASNGNGEQGRDLSWDECLRVLQTYEPQATSASEVSADTWFERGRATILMDVSIQNQQFELQINDDSIPEDVAAAFVLENRVDQKFLRPLAEQIRATALQACREELRLCRGERAEMTANLLRTEQILVDREKRVAEQTKVLARSDGSERAGLDGSVNPRVLRELTEQVAELSEQLAIAQQSAPVRSAPLGFATGSSTGVESFGATGRSSTTGVDTGGAGGDFGLDDNFSEVDADGDGQISRSEWRKWVAEKQRIMKAANKDRETLMNENRRLRMAMSPSAKSVADRSRRSDERLVELEAKKAELEIQRNVDEAEFKASIHEVKQVNAHLQTMLFSVSVTTATDETQTGPHFLC